MPSESELQQRFEACIDACAESLFRVAYRLTGNDTMARELVQETYLNAWQGLPSLSDPKKMRGWMFAILRNQYTKQLRSEKKAVSTTELSLDTAASTIRSDTDQDAMVRQALETLDEKFKLPLLLVAMEQWTVDEAAEVLEIPRGTVLSRLHRGREKLKNYLSRAEKQLAPSRSKDEANHVE